MHDPHTPSARVIGDANAAAVVTDKQGRELTLRYPSAFLRMRLARLVGSELQQNQEWWGNAIVALCVTAVGEIPTPELRTAEQVESLILKLDDDGLVAVAKWLQKQGEIRNQDLVDEAKNG